MPNLLDYRLPWKARRILYEKVGFRPLPPQEKPLADTDVPFLVFAGGVGAGKSFTAAKYLLPEVIPDYMRAALLKAAGYSVEYKGEKRRYFWLAAPDYTLARREFDLLAQDLHILGVELDGPNMPQEGPWWMRIKESKTEIESKSATQPDSFHSKPVQGILACEAALISPYVRTERLIPRVMRGVIDGWMFCSGTFEGVENWLVNAYEEGNEEGGSWHSYSMASWENTVDHPNISDKTKAWLAWYVKTLPTIREMSEVVNQEAMVRLKREAQDIYYALANMPSDSFAQRFGAIPQKPTGLVFPEFDPRAHVDAGVVFDDTKKVEVWIDPGVENPYSVLAVQVDGTDVFVIDEVYYRHCSSEEMINECVSRPWWDNVTGGQIDATQLEQKAIWQRGEVWNRVKKTPPYLRAQKVLIETGIERTRLWLRDPGTGDAHLHFSPKCNNTIAEFSKYRWPTFKAGDLTVRKAPEDRHNHCVVGDTLVEMPGGARPIKDLVGQTPYVYCCVDGKVSVRKAYDVHLTMKDADIVRVMMDRGSLYCTPDHLIMLADGRYVEAGKLRPGERLMAFNRYMAGDGYSHICMTNETKNTKLEHKLVYQELHGVLPAGWHVHHIDGRCWNHAPENLVALTIDDHASLHHRGKEISEWHRERISAASKQRWAEDDGSRRDQVRRNSEKAHEANRGRVISEEERERLGRISREAWDRPGYREAAAARKRGSTLSAEGKKKVSDAKKKYWQTRRETGENHKVWAVLPAGKADVYDLNVEEAHNFIANDICVHNSIKCLAYGLVGLFGIGTHFEALGTRQLEYRPRFPVR